MPTSEPTDLPNLLSVATLIKPHGVRGELKINAPEEYLELLRDFVEAEEHVALRKKDALSSVSICIEHIRGSNNAAIIKLEGVDDRNEAETLRGANILVEREFLPELEDDEYFLADLRGCKAYDKATDELIGDVVDAEIFPANIVLSVEVLKQNKVILVPFIELAVPRVEIEEKRLYIDLAYLDIEAEE